MGLVLGLILLGFLLLLAEVFLPGGVVGLMGVICLAFGIAIGYLELGTNAGHILLLSVLALSAGGTVAWFKYLPTSRFGRRLIFNGAGAPRPADFRGELLHAKGVALTPLRPAGIALFGSRRVDVLSDGDFVEPGAPIKVVQVDGRRVLVRPEQR